MDRKLYIGSSDARDILSGDWERLYRRKMGLDAEPDFTGNFAVQLGILTEPFHLDWTLRALGDERGVPYTWAKADDKGEQFFSTFVPSHFGTTLKLGSHPDALMKSDTGLTLPIEVKHTGRFKNAEETAEFYMPQLQHHMICWGVDNMLLSVIVGNSEPERIWIGYSEQWADHYIARCAAFWTHVAEQVPPAPLFTDIRKPLVPAKVKDSVPLNGMTKRDMNGNNRFKALALEYIETHAAVKKHEKAKTDLKEMVAADESELYSDLLTMKRNKAGSILFTVHEK